MGVGGREEVSGSNHGGQADLWAPPQGQTCHMWARPGLVFSVLWGRDCSCFGKPPLRELQPGPAIGEEHGGLPFIGVRVANMMFAVPNQECKVTWSLLMGIVDVFADHTARPGMTQCPMGVSHSSLRTPLLSPLCG